MMFGSELQMFGAELQVRKGRKSYKEAECNEQGNTPGWSGKQGVSTLLGKPH